MMIIWRGNVKVLGEMEEGGCSWDGKADANYEGVAGGVEGPKKGGE